MDCANHIRPCLRRSRHPVGNGWVGNYAFAGVNIWLNYALSLERKSYIFILVGIVVLQVGLMLAFHPQLETIALIMIGAGLVGNLVGAATTLIQSQSATPPAAS
ncbi:MAG: hypothetical protein R3C44_16735 [Chloroflexota bacterium]